MGRAAAERHGRDEAAGCDRPKGTTRFNLQRPKAESDYGGSSAGAITWFWQPASRAFARGYGWQKVDDGVKLASQLRAPFQPLSAGHHSPGSGRKHKSKKTIRGANVKLNGPQTGRVQGTFEWQLKHWVAVVWIEATSPSSCSRLYRERDRPRMTPKKRGPSPATPRPGTASANPYSPTMGYQRMCNLSVNRLWFGHAFQDNGNYPDQSRRIGTRD